jgi:cytochrome oxidase Cu insertion factor (SCO1/SenC/PrrC family)
VEVLVQIKEPHTIALVSEKGRTGPVGDGYPRTVLMTVKCEGEAVDAVQLPVERSCCAPPIEDYRNLSIDNKRLIVFNETDDDFRVNNRIFNEDRIDTRVALGMVEEWTIRNATDELHQFHIHQMDFQMVEMNGKPVEFTGHRDNIIVPIRGEEKLIMPFTDPVMVGNFVYHCHIVEHEDGGMMAIIQVYDPANPDAIPAPWEHVVVPPANSQAQGGPIELMDQDGREWKSQLTDAHLMLVTFGYTRCKYACPRTQTLLSQTMGVLGDDAKRVQPVIVTIDPQRDTVAIMHEYVEGAGFPLIGLTGTAADIARVAGQFGVAYQPLPMQPDGSYGMSHSTDVFLTTRDGRVVDRFDLITPAEKIAQRSREALGAQASLTEGGVR